ncbi:hypothetical protein C8J57DRAFT_1515892 [Mycena rebaudengoi]|nr:hypothetical protein C8J57DRAFT_1515892 [Mycena rebaudengoi]
MGLNGVKHHLVPLENADIYPAQRISIILQPNQAVGNYWDSFAEVPRPTWKRSNRQPELDEVPSALGSWCPRVNISIPGGGKFRLSLEPENWFSGS